jgi:DNA-binding Lrp family transcriptional regulator
MGFSNLLSRHGLALLCVARERDSRLREIAEFVGVTERAAHTLVSDLVAAGYLERHRIGNRNRYELRPDAPLPDRGLDDRQLGELLELFSTNHS